MEVCMTLPNMISTGIVFRNQSNPADSAARFRIPRMLYNGSSCYGFPETRQVKHVMIFNFPLVLQLLINFLHRGFAVFSKLVFSRSWLVNSTQNRTS